MPLHLLVGRGAGEEDIADGQEAFGCTSKQRRWYFCRPACLRRTRLPSSGLQTSGQFWRNAITKRTSLRLERLDYMLIPSESAAFTSRSKRTPARVGRDQCAPVGCDFSVQYRIVSM